MKNVLGNNITLTLFGESHGAAIGAVIDGLSPGIPVDEERIAEKLSRRRPSSSTDTSRREPDIFKILSGVFEGKTTGTPVCIVIPNEDTKSVDYSPMREIARPAHADYTAYCKYHGFEDYRGGGHFSGRITAAIVAAGAIAETALEMRGVKVGCHILECGGVWDRPFEDCISDIDILKSASFPVLRLGAGEQITERILKAKEQCDSVGGVVQTAVVGLPAGLGEPWFDSVESQISRAAFSIGGVKGIEFGLGFALADMQGSEANDPFVINNGKVETLSNNDGGINGGITNGMPIVFNCAVKPTPSIYKEQKTVNFVKNEETTLQIKGRHDPAIIRRICPVMEAVTALVICDMLSGRYGTDVFIKGVKE